jgi:hypothetical protein
MKYEKIFTEIEIKKIDKIMEYWPFIPVEVIP